MNTTFRRFVFLFNFAFLPMLALATFTQSSKAQSALYLPAVHQTSQSPFVVWSPSGHTFSMNISNGLHLYNVTTTSVETIVLEGVGIPQFSADGDMFIANRTLFDTNSGEPLLPDAAGWTQNGEVLITVTNGSTEETHLMHLESAQQFEEFAVLPTSGQVILSPDETRAAVIKGGYSVEELVPWTIELWDVEAEDLVTTIVLNLYDFFTPLFSPDSRWLVLADFDSEGIIGGNTRLINTETGELAAQWGNLDGEAQFTENGLLLLPLDRMTLLHPENADYSLDLGWSINPDGQLGRWLLDLDKTYLAFQSPDTDEVSLWDLTTALETREPVAVLPRRRLTELSPDGTLLALIDKDQAISVHEMSNGDLVMRTTFPTEGMYIGVAFSHDSTMMATITQHNEVSLWNTRTGTLAHTTSLDSEILMPHLSFSPDNRMIHIYSSEFVHDGVVIDSLTGEEVLQFPSQGYNTLSPDWHYATYWENTTLILFNFENRTETDLLTLENS